MPALTPLNMLLVGIVFILLILLGLIWSNRRHKAHSQAAQYRTANGRDIDAQSKAILQRPMAIRRVRAGQFTGLHIVPAPHSMPTPLHQVRTQRHPLPGYSESNQASVRGTAAALYDMGHGGKRRAGPYTLGSTQHADWLKAYEAAFTPKPATVQTSAQSAKEPAAA